MTLVSFYSGADIHVPWQWPQLIVGWRGTKFCALTGLSFAEPSADLYLVSQGGKSPKNISGPSGLRLINGILVCYPEIVDGKPTYREESLRQGVFLSDDLGHFGITIKRMRLSIGQNAHARTASARRFLIAFCVLVAITQLLFAQNVLHWNWRRSSYIEKPISELNLSEQKRRAIAKAVAVQLREDQDDGAASTEEELGQIMSTTMAELVDLTGHGKHEVVTQGPRDWCSPTGNCLVLVFRESKGGYQLLLKRGAVQTFTVQPTRTNGFNDIILYQHGSAFDGGATLYQFKNGSYHDTACYDVVWSEEDGDVVRELKQPRFTPCKY